MILNCNLTDSYGGVAQLGERTVRIRKVVGSNPIGSTKLGLCILSQYFSLIVNEFEIM